MSREGYVSTPEGLQLHYRFEGQGPDTLVMIHGGPGMDFGYMAADFAPLAQRHTLLFYDQRGGGYSTLPQDTALLHIDDHVADLEVIREHFGMERLTLVAHSFGPAVAAKYAMAYPERVARMIFLGPVPPLQGDFYARYGERLASRLSVEEQQALDSLFRAMVSGPEVVAACRKYWEIALKPRLAKGMEVGIIKGDCCLAPPEAISYGMSKTNAVTSASLGNWDWRPELKKLPVPTLIIHGEEESIPMDMVEEWATALPNSELIKVPQAAHFPYVERPDIVWPAMEAFLREAGRTF